MHIKIIAVVVALAALAGGVWYFGLLPQSAVPASQATPEPKKAEISWEFKDAGEQEHIPYTTVMVTVNGTTHEVGNFQGSCSEVGATGGVDGKGLLAGELSAAQCWFAGGGDEIGIFATEDGGLELMTGSLEEPVEGSEGFRGDFTIRSEFVL